MHAPLIKKIVEYVKIKLYNNPTGHDWYHVERVWKIAKRLQEVEGGDAELIEIAALLHNLGDHSDAKFNIATKGSLILYGMMDILGVEEPLKSKVINIIDEMKFAGYQTKPPVTLEGKIVQDANFLDSLGAIGVARQLASGGFHGRPIYDPQKKVRGRLTRDEYQLQKGKGTSINNFYEKSLEMVKLMNTATAKQIAAGRVKFIKIFLDQFFKEWKENHDEGNEK